MYHSMLSTRKTLVVAAAMIAANLVAVRAATAASDPVKCQQTISAAAQKYEDARAKTLGKCEEAKVKGKLAVTTVCDATVAPPGDQKTIDKIAKADVKRAGAIAKACGGDDKAFGGGDDLALSAIGWDGRVPACDQGERDGLSCQTNADCPGKCLDGTREGEGVNCTSEASTTSLCPSGCVGACVGGGNAGNDCTADSDCPGSTCGSKVCLGGTNDGNACTVATDCPGNNFCDISNGCGTGGRVTDECPDIEKSGCDNVLATLADIDTCVKCVSETGVDQVVDNFYASLSPLSTDKALEKCKQAIGKNGMKYLSAHRKAIAGCQKNALKDGAANSCPDLKATDKINKARTKLLAGIEKACGGDDKVFGGGDDITPDAIGAPLSCPNVDPPGATPGCYDFIATVQDLANCGACLVDFKAIVLDAVAVTADDPTPTELNALCGNGKIDAGETCDDGNVVDGDACPGNCSIASCAVTGSATATVTFTVPGGTDVTALSIYLDYPEAAVAIPGSGSQAAVQNAITLIPGNNATFTPNDLNYALRNVIVDNDVPPAPLPPGAPGLFDIALQRCGAAPLPVPGDFNCRVDSASAAGGVSVFSATCAVTAVTP